MHALSLLQQSLKKSLSFLHQARLKALFAAVAGLVGGGRLSLTALGRRMPLPTDGKRRHQIKRVDRLLGNRRLMSERPQIYRVIAHKVIGSAVRIPVVVDWTPVGAANKFSALVASVPVRGRVVPIYAEVHPIKKLSNPDVEQRFLKGLKNCIPAHCAPVIITDAGFRVPWYRAVLDQGWDFIGRGRGTVQIEVKAGVWRSIRDLFRRARRQPSDLGTLAVTQKSSFPARVILCREQKLKKSRRAACKRRKLPAKRDDMNQSERYRTAAREPWLLLTSCKCISAQRVVAFYKTRMSIEETFRDLKSHRFGWSFEDARCKKAPRYDVLLLIATLALLAVTLTGMVAEQLKLHHGHQANTVRSRRVLSLFFLGRCVLGDKQDGSFTVTDFSAASTKLSRYLGSVGS